MIPTYTSRMGSTENVLERVMCKKGRTCLNVVALEHAQWKSNDMLQTNLMTAEYVAIPPGERQFPLFVRCCALANKFARTISASLLTFQKILDSLPGYVSNRTGPTFLGSVFFLFTRMWLAHIRSVCMKVPASGLWTELRRRSNSYWCTSRYVDSHEGSTPCIRRCPGSVPCSPFWRMCNWLCNSTHEWTTTLVIEDPVETLLL